MIKEICTDFGGILFPIQPYNNKPEKEFFIKIKQLVIDIYNKREQEIEAGSYTTKHFNADLEFNGKEFSKEQLHYIYQSITVINQPLLDLFSELKKETKICALVNEAPKWTELRVYFHKLHNLFTNIYISAYIGLNKPDHEAYKAMLIKESVKPEEVIFIDDSDVNVKAAKELGINAIKFESFDQTREVIKLLLQ